MALSTFPTRPAHGLDRVQSHAVMRAPPPDPDPAPQKGTAPRPPDPHPLIALLQELETLADQGPTVRVGSVMTATGHYSHDIALLVPAMILVSPLSVIFGLPTLTALVMLLICVQALAGRRHLWLPRVLRNRQIGSDRFRAAMRWLHRPVGWVVRHQRPRVTVLISRPGRIAGWLCALAICLIIPLLEFLPMVTSVACLAISLLALGQVLRDGAYALAGYAMIAAALWLLVTLLG